MDVPATFLRRHPIPSPSLVIWQFYFDKVILLCGYMFTVRLHNASHWVNDVYHMHMTHLNSAELGVCSLKPISVARGATSACHFIEFHYRCPAFCYALYVVKKSLNICHLSICSCWGKIKMRHMTQLPGALGSDTSPFLRSQLLGGWLSLHLTAVPIIFITLLYGLPVYRHLQVVWMR